MASKRRISFPNFLHRIKSYKYQEDSRILYRIIVIVKLKSTI